MPKWNSDSWVSLSPNGIGHIKPNHYFEIARTIWRNRDQLPFAWRILTRGVCDGCALGTAGVRDFTMDGVHLCLVRLELLRLNTMPALDIDRLRDVESLRRLTPDALRDLGRLPFPMIRRKGEPGFSRVSWDEALDEIAGKLRPLVPERVAFYMTSRGLTNETYYVAQKAARFLGTNNIDNSSRICHAPSTVALKQSLGVAASTCSYSDWVGTDLLVLFGSNLPNNQPVTTKYIYFAKKAGTRVVVINPYREPGLERYWVPSVPESALFGTKIADEFFQINTGGDRAFIAGVLKCLADQQALDRDFISKHTSGLDELLSSIDRFSWPVLEKMSGATREKMSLFATLLAQAKSGVFVWSMGITQHSNGVENVKAIVNLALSRGFIGREKCGLMAIRGHSGVQGGAEVGAVPNQFPGGLAIEPDSAARVSQQWGFTVPGSPGLNAIEMIDAAHEGDLDLLYQIGGNFLDTLPEPEYVRESLEKIPVRVHQDLFLTTQMLLEPADTVFLLPGQTRYEQSGGGTETSTERRILFSPEIPGRRIGEAKPEWEIPMLIAARTRPERAALISFQDAQSIREELARLVPAYEGIQRLKDTGDQVQWGGQRLCETREAGRSVPRFSTSDGKAHFSKMVFEEAPKNGAFVLSTRRGKQFNSMVHLNRDPLTGARRDDLLMSIEDAERLQLREGDWVMVRSAVGEMRARCRIAAIAPGNVQAHWPEANVLIRRGATDKSCGIPDYNVEVQIERFV